MKKQSPKRPAVWHLLQAKRGDNECWEWQGSINANGYGYCSFEGGKYLAHRLAWQLLVGPIREGLEIDHLCKNTKCVNPAHLEPVLPYVNNMRSNSPAATAARKTHCVNGHPFDEENTKVILRPRGRVDRRCKACHRERARERYRKISQNGRQPSS